MLLESVHAHIYLVNLVAGAVSENTSRDEKPSVLLGIDESWALRQLLTLDSNSAFCVLEWLIEVHGMILDFNELVLMGLNSKLYFNVLLKLLSAVYLVENKLVVEGISDDFLEFFSEWLEVFVHLENILLAIYNVHKFGVIDLLLHLKVDRRYLFELFIKLLVLLFNLCDHIFLVLLLLVVSLPELLLDPLHLATGQFEKLLCLNGLLLVEVASELELLFDVAHRIFDVLNVILHLVDLLFGKVLEHLDVVLGPTMVLETLSAQGLCMAKAIVDVIVFMFRTNVVVADDSAVVGDRTDHGFSWKGLLVIDLQICFNREIGKRFTSTTSSSCKSTH